MTESVRSDIFKKTFSKKSGQEEAKVISVQVENSPVIKNYLLETRWLSHALKVQPKSVGEILRVISITKDNSLLLGFTPVYRIFCLIEDLYKGLLDRKISFSQNLIILLQSVSELIARLCSLIEKGDMEELFETDIRDYLLYLDKALAGEIFNAAKIAPKKEKRLFLENPSKKAGACEKEESHAPEKESFVQVPSEKIDELVYMQEDLIARSYILMNQVELLKNAIREGDMREARESFKQIAADSQNLQNTLLVAHDNLMGLVHDDKFLARHKEFQGFFVLANGRKYLIPSEYVVDVVTGSSLDYVEKMNQKYLVYIQENESGTEKTREDIPVYFLSSLLPGKPSSNHAVLDSIFIVNYQAQKIGIVVEKMQKFVSLIQTPMPPAFSNFPLLKGLAFDEKYDMIPILYIPELMKKFRSMRPYVQKVFDAYSRKRSQRVLIVEDSSTTRLIEHSILESQGFLVEEAADGIEAMAKIKEGQFDLILCDDDMPRMDGELFLDNLRRMENYKKIPVIAVSNTSIEKADYFISKSGFERENLIQKIREIFGGEDK